METWKLRQMVRNVQFQQDPHDKAKHEFLFLVSSDAAWSMVWQHSLGGMLPGLQTFFLWRCLLLKKIIIKS